MQIEKEKKYTMMMTSNKRKFDELDDESKVATATNDSISKFVRSIMDKTRGDIQRKVMILDTVKDKQIDAAKRLRNLQIQNANQHYDYEIHASVNLFRVWYPPLFFVSVLTCFFDRRHHVKRFKRM
jgi:hypothetical protein